MLFDRVATLGQRIGNSNTLSIGGHAADQLFALVNIKNDPFQQGAVFCVALDDMNKALVLFIGDGHCVGLFMLRDIHGSGKMGIYIMRGAFGLGDLVLAPIQPARLCDTVLVGGQSGGKKSFCIITMGERSRKLSDCELHALQSRAGIGVGLDDPDLALNDGINRISDFHLSLLVDAYGVILLYQLIAFRCFDLMGKVFAVFHGVVPGGFAFRIRRHGGQLVPICAYGADILIAGFGEQFKLCSCQRNARPFGFFHQLDRTDDRGISHRQGVAAVDRHLILVQIHVIAGRRAGFLHGIRSIRKLRPGHGAIRASGLGTAVSIAIGIIELEGRACQRFHAAAITHLGDGQAAILGFFLKPQGNALHGIRRTIDRDQHLLNLGVRNADHKTGFLGIGIDGFGIQGEAVDGGGNYHRVPAVQVVIAAVAAQRIARQTAHGTGNTDHVRVGRERDTAVVFSICGKHEFVGFRDISGDASTGNAVVGQPLGIFQVFRRGLIAASIEAVQIPIIPDILSAFQLFDHFSDGKLSRDTRPGIIVGVIPIQHHEGIGMTQHPGNGMEGGLLINNPAVTGIIHIGIYIHDNVGAGGLLAAAGFVLAGAGIGVFQTIYGNAFQVMRRRIYSAMAGQLGNLLIGAVGAGGAIQRILPHIKAAHRSIGSAQTETVGRCCRFQQAALFCRRRGQSVIRNGTFIRFRFRGFLCQHPGKAIACPF